MNSLCCLLLFHFHLPPVIILSFIAGCVVTVLPYPIPCARRAVGPAEGQSYLSPVSPFPPIKCHLTLSDKHLYKRRSRFNTSINPTTLHFAYKCIELYNHFQLHRRSKKTNGG